MKCPKCDIRYESDVNFCAECGSKLIKCRSLDETVNRIQKSSLENKANINQLDIIIKQNKKIIELLEIIARK